MPHFYLFGALFGWIIGKCNLCPPSETLPQAGGKTEEKGVLQAEQAGHRGRKAGE